MTASRAAWEQRHGSRLPGDPEPFVVEMLPLLPRGRALDVAAGRGRHSILLARVGLAVIAVDYAVPGLATLAAAAAEEHLPIFPIAADMADFPLRPRCYDLIVNVNFLERSLLPALKNALKPGGALLFDTYLIGQAKVGHPRSPQYLLNHGELRELLAGMEVVRHREGAVRGREGALEYRSSALAIKRD